MINHSSGNIDNCGSCFLYISKEDKQVKLIRRLNFKKYIVPLIIILILNMVAVVYAEELNVFTSEIKLFINGLPSQEKVVVINGRNHVAVEEIASMFGAEVAWLEETNSINLIQHMPPYQHKQQRFAEGYYLGEVNFTYDNGTVYSGGYRNGKFHGEGKIIYANGTKYEGYFVDGRLEGKGKYTALNGDVYDGYFKNNDFNGYGTYTYANGDKISGQFKGNKIQGTVHVVYKISGEKENVIQWDREIQKIDIYDATFNPNFYNGKAEIVYNNGTIYKGYVSNNMFNGKGKITYIDGSSYDGQWVKDQKTGYGKYTYANNEEYKGYFVSGQYEGSGTYIYANGDKYHGNWHNSMKEGEGVYTYANGSKFIGAWKEDKKHTIGYKGRSWDDKRDYGKYIVEKDTLYKKFISYDRLKDEVYYQRWDEGELVREVKEKK